ncbi:MAG: DEAD/DEAH box helicase [Clostridiales bacterium]|jgi:ATP-dependent RNA helicase RhlE|nr:DEAD/DEAH box helicase [Clostridiales bacterium]OPZ68204.1 MAG: ATP-dependent RNA helicase RhlE [Firmicutes bacterium ADurb.Bin467]
MNFEEMQLIPPLLRSVEQSGYEVPTPIQRATIPLVLAGKDVLGCAQTGTGKTAAFALPILQRLNAGRPAQGNRPIRSLILTPTRELAQQIYESFLTYGSKKLSLSVCCIFGGVNQQPQTEQLRRGVDIMVATPGRLNDLIGQGYIRLDGIEIFVLDEADRMLDMGFIHDVEKVIALLPTKRQTLFFSATMPKEVEALALKILSNPSTVKVDPVTSTVDSIRQALYYVDKTNKKLLLAHLLKDPAVESALIFARTRHGADRVVKDLEKAGIRALAIHGSKSQSARQEALAQFKSGRLNALVATDIAARGIDIVGLSHVFNYDLPNEPEVYIHRIGRTGRAGLGGDAVSFCCIDELKDLRAIESLIGKRIPVLESPWPMEVLTPSEPKPRMPRPAKLNRQGNPLPERKPRPQSAEPAAPNQRRGGRPRRGRD